MRGKILSMGEALVDVLPAANGLWRPVPGGSSFNVALALARLGAPAAFAGRLSRDEQGESMFATLCAEGVDVDLVTRDDRPSPLSLIERGSETGSARYSIYLSGSAHAPPKLAANWMDGVAHLHVSSFSAVAGEWGAAAEEALRAARGRISASFDINIRPALIPPRSETVALIERRAALVDIVKASEDDLAWLFPGRPSDEIAREWSQRFSCLVLLTRGGAGATGFASGESVDSVAPRVEIADTVGAGDTFIAGFLACAQAARRLGIRPVEPGDLEVWLAFANHAAALCCARHGAQSPRLAEVEALIASS